MKIILNSTLFILLISIVLSKRSKIEPDKIEICSAITKPKIYSWHVHVMFWQNNKKNLEEALDLRNRFIIEFRDILDNEICNDGFINSKSCMFKPELEPRGPHITGQWAAFFLPEHYSLIVPWIMQNRRKFSFTVHPNTGCRKLDITEWSIWGGTPLPHNMDNFIDIDFVPLNLGLKGLVSQLNLRSHK